MIRTSEEFRFCGGCLSRSSETKNRLQGQNQDRQRRISVNLSPVHKSKKYHVRDAFFQFSVLCTLVGVQGQTILCEVRALSAGNSALKEAKLRPKCEPGKSASREKAGSRLLHFSREAQADARSAASPWCAALWRPRPACLKPRQA